MNYSGIPGAPLISLSAQSALFIACIAALVWSAVLIWIAADPRLPFAIPKLLRRRMLIGARMALLGAALLGCIVYASGRLLAPDIPIVSASAPIDRRVFAWIVPILLLACVAAIIMERRMPWERVSTDPNCANCGHAAADLVRCTECGMLLSDGGILKGEARRRPAISGWYTFGAFLTRISWALLAAALLHTAIPLPVTYTAFVLTRSQEKYTINNDLRAQCRGRARLHEPPSSLYETFGSFTGQMRLAVDGVNPTKPLRLSVRRNRGDEWATVEFRGKTAPAFWQELKALLAAAYATDVADAAAEMVQKTVMLIAGKQGVSRPRRPGLTARGVYAIYLTPLSIVVMLLPAAAAWAGVAASDRRLRCEPRTK